MIYHKSGSFYPYPAKTSWQKFRHNTIRSCLHLNICAFKNTHKTHKITDFHFKLIMPIYVEIPPLDKMTLTGISLSVVCSRILTISSTKQKWQEAPHTVTFSSITATGIVASSKPVIKEIPSSPKASSKNTLPSITSIDIKGNSI